MTFLLALTAAMLSANNTASSTNCLSRRAFTWCLREGDKEGLGKEGEGEGGRVGGRVGGEGRGRGGGKEGWQEERKEDE